MVERLQGNLLAIGLPCIDPEILPRRNRAISLAARFFECVAFQSRPFHTQVSSVEQPCPRPILKCDYPGESDVILAVNAVPTRDVRAVSRAILASEPRRTVRARIWRDGRTLDLPIAVENWPDDATNPAGTPVTPARGQRMNGMNLGLRLSELDDQLRQQYRLAGAQQGVLVFGVAANSPGADAAFAVGDIIVRVQNTPITSNAEPEKAVWAVWDAGRPLVLVLVRNEKGTRWIASPVPAR